MRPIDDLSARLTEETCLDAVLRLQRGDAPCPACDARAGFRLAGKHRSFACRSCGFQTYPLLGTPFAKAPPTVKEWFLAVYMAAGRERLRARDLRTALGLDARTAEQLASGVEALRTGGEAAGTGVDWFDGIRDVVEDEAAKAVPAVPAAPVVARALASDQVRWHWVGLAAILLLAAAGAGIGWLAVPGVPEEDPELAQATAILSLASDRPVILVTADVAKQLYDVSDVDADAPGSAGAPHLPSIRLAPAGDGGTAGESKPLAQPSVRLSNNAGQSILSGDLSSVQKSGSRPELAAYQALARELESKGPRNPDELLSFGPMKIRRHLVEKVTRAALQVKMDPILLMAIADKESSFATEVQASTSSATGLFQFIERTWLGVVRDFGPAYGLDREAKLAAASGLDPAERGRILDLRRDAYLSAVMTAEMLKRDALRIQKKMGRNLSGGEIYLLHFLGPDGTEKLLDRVAQAPSAAAAELLPKPAEANKSIFYAAGEGGPKALSVSEIKGKFDTMISVRLDRYKGVAGTTAGRPEPAARPEPTAPRR